LRAAGCELQLLDIATGVARYMSWLSAQGRASPGADGEIRRDQISAGVS
jgi:hypothetical protein